VITTALNDHRHDTMSNSR